MHPHLSPLPSRQRKEAGLLMLDFLSNYVILHYAKIHNVMRTI
jgi:hypothetical protein